MSGVFGVDDDLMIAQYILYITMLPTATLKWMLIFYTSTVKGWLYSPRRAVSVDPQHYEDDCAI